MNSIVLFGVRSPLLPDYEESCSRLGLTIAAAVRVDALRARILDRSTVTDLSELSEGHDLPGFVACAFNPYRREELTILADKAGLAAAEPLVDATSVIASSTRIGSGTYINAGVVIGAAGVIGEHVCISRSTNIGHHVQLGNFVSIGPGVTLAGNVHVGTHSFIGAGSTVLPGIRIGERAIVAAGSVVKDDVSSDVLVAGIPAKATRTRASAKSLGEEGEE